MAKEWFRKQTPKRSPGTNSSTAEDAANTRFVWEGLQDRISHMSRSTQAAVRVKIIFLQKQHSPLPIVMMAADPERTVEMRLPAHSEPGSFLFCAGFWTRFFHYHCTYCRVHDLAEPGTPSCRDPVCMVSLPLGLTYEMVPISRVTDVGVLNKEWILMILKCFNWLVH